MLGEVALLGLIGIATGVPLAFAATRLFSTLLFRVSPWDVPTFVAATLLLAAVLLMTSFLPARRATGIEPSPALRVFQPVTRNAVLIRQEFHVGYRNFSPSIGADAAETENNLISLSNQPQLGCNVLFLHGFFVSFL